MTYIPPHKRDEQKRRITQDDPKYNIPTVTLSDQVDEAAASTLLQGLTTTGFTLVSAPDVLSVELCERALRESARIMASDNDCEMGVKKSMSFLRKGGRGKGDYKDSLMLRLQHAQQNKTLTELWNVLQVVKYRVLRAIDQQLGVDLSSIHKPETDSMRLLHYPEVNNDEIATRMKKGNQCYAYVDYGTITLLISDKAGLEVAKPSPGNAEAKQWIPVPYQPATVAVNVGRELLDDILPHSKLKAAMHRVPGPHSRGSSLMDRSSERYAIALFVQKQLYQDSSGAGKETPRGNSEGSYQATAR